MFKLLGIGLLAASFVPASTALAGCGHSTGSGGGAVASAGDDRPGRWSLAAHILVRSGDGLVPRLPRALDAREWRLEP